MDGKQLFPTSEGTPQGGVISPLLANIALHGMENRIKQYAETLKGKKRINKEALSLIRYADDFVILHENIAVVQRCREIISEWLNDIGLELKPSKTRLAHTLNNHEQQEPGFNFLGFNIRQFKVGKFSSGKDGHGKILGFKTIITPSKQKQKVHYDQIASVIEAHKAAPQAALISRLNPIIRGWANYYATVVSKVAYSDIDNLTYQKLRAWAKRRCGNINSGHSKYWTAIGGSNWVFATRNGDNPLRLLKHSEFGSSSTNYVKVKGDKSPYDGDLVYWSSRLGKNPEMPSRKAKLLKQQKGKCPWCGLHFQEWDVLEVDHKIPRALSGKDEWKNLQLLHRHCHNEKTALDGSLKSNNDKRKHVE